MRHSMKNPLKALLTLTAAILLLFAVPAWAGDVVDTWKKRIDQAPASVTGPIPVVLYVHGCDGYGKGFGHRFPSTTTWLETVTHAGWKFVAPDSWARGTWSRPTTCPGPNNERQPLENSLKVRLMRIEEIAYAVARLQEDPTVDQSRIVLFGHSEGGIAVATSVPPPGIRGLIISGWTCHAIIPLGMGIAAPPSIPVLAINFERDTVIGVQGRCSEFFPGRTDARELILPGAGHITADFPDTQKAIVEFLGGLR
jgi:dienelactone hydrolase